LNVGSVLEGSVRRDGQRIRVSAELIDVTTGFDLWTQTYERNVDDLFAVQDQITQAIIEALKIKLAVAIPVRKSVDPEAYDLYLQGVFYSNKSREQALRQILDLFDRSLRKQAGSADAWAGIAKDWNYLSDAYMRPLDAYPQSKAAALKALAIDEDNADAHARSRHRRLQCRTAARAATEPEFEPGADVPGAEPGHCWLSGRRDSPHAAGTQDRPALTAAKRLRRAALSGHRSLRRRG